MKKEREGADLDENESMIPEMAEEKNSTLEVPRNSDGLMEFDNATHIDNAEDDLYETAKQEVIRMKKASASLLQRRLRVGYARAARLLDVLEERGVIGPADGAKPREVFVTEGNDDTANYGPEADFADEMKDQEVRDKWDV